VSRTPVTTPRAGSRPPAAAGPSRRRWRRPGAIPTVIVLATLAGLVLRLYQLSRPGYLLGVTEYDDGTDFGSAIRLVHGALPYRDFIMVQPPGITLLMAPVAAATSSFGTVTGMAVARVFTALASAAAIPLGGLLTRHRGVLAVLVTCGTLAVYPDSMLAARTVLLEPWLVLFCLLGALAVFDGDRPVTGWRLIWGGAAFGFAGAVKVWAILPVLVILVLTARRPPQAGRFAAGVAAGFCLPVLPFALLAPVTFYRGVIVAQLLRSDVQRVPAASRLQDMLGLTHLPVGSTAPLVVTGVAVIVVVAALMAAGSWLSHRWPPPLDWFAAVTCLLVAAAFLWPADFYEHYAAFLAPFLALSLALPIARMVAVLPRQGKRARLGRVTRRAAIAAAAVTLATLAVLQGIAESHLASAVPASELSAAERTIPAGACVLTDQVAYTIAINRFAATDPGCSLMVDGVGSDYALSQGHNGLTGAGQTPAVEQMWLSAFRAARYVWLTGMASRRIPWTPPLTAYFRTHFRPLIKGPVWLYVRRPG
jgi:alpha-1,2-mannosyltransferase